MLIEAPTGNSGTEEIETVFRRHQKTPDEVARLAEGVLPFSYEEWQQSAPPATPEQLADWEEFLRQHRAFVHR